MLILLTSGKTVTFPTGAKVLANYPSLSDPEIVVLDATGKELARFVRDQVVGWMPSTTSHTVANT